MTRRKLYHVDARIRYTYNNMYTACTIAYFETTLRRGGVQRARSVSYVVRVGEACGDALNERP